MTQEAAAGTAREMAEDQLSAELLQSVVDVARFIFGAQASSVFLLDEEAHELVFQAVSGQGEGSLVGRAFPAGNGIAPAYAPVGGTSNPTSLLTYNGPVSNDPVTIGFKQSIGKNDALRTGSYSKTLTFTLSTTQP